MPHNNLPTSFPPGRFPVRIPVRMTQEERATIGRNACALNRSISRYLVELATSDKSRPLPEDRAQTKFLHSLFHAATEKVRAVLASERLAQGTGEEIVYARATLGETLRLLEAIGKELGRRLA